MLKYCFRNIRFKIILILTWLFNFLFLSRRATDPIISGYNVDAEELKVDVSQIERKQQSFHPKVLHHTTIRYLKQSVFMFNILSRNLRPQKNDMKTKHLDRLKHALYENLKQHAGKYYWFIDRKIILIYHCDCFNTYQSKIYRLLFPMKHSVEFIQIMKFIICIWVMT